MLKHNPRFRACFEMGATAGRASSGTQISTDIQYSKIRFQRFLNAGLSTFPLFVLGNDAKNSTN